MEHYKKISTLKWAGRIVRMVEERIIRLLMTKLEKNSKKESQNQMGEWCGTGYGEVETKELKETDLNGKNF